MVGSFQIYIHIKHLHLNFDFETCNVHVSTKYKPFGKSSYLCVSALIMWRAATNKSVNGKHLDTGISQMARADPPYTQNRPTQTPADPLLPKMFSF